MQDPNDFYFFAHLAIVRDDLFTFCPVTNSRRY